MRTFLLLALTLSPLFSQPLAAQPNPDPFAESAETDKKVEPIVAKVRKSLVTIRVQGRDGQQLGMGTGFVVDPSGLIATNSHVIMEGRPFTVELSNKKKLKVLEVNASDRAMDLAIIKVDPDGAPLDVLEMADDGQIAQGAAVLAFGNPLGLQMSVVKGVVSAIREVDGKRMIQMAMPIEFGNSGGPLVDLSGRVHGIVNMKSAVEKSVGFAIPVQRLRELRQRPNPVVIDRWVRLGRLNADRWTTLFGADWQQRGGVISVRGKGDGFGGRSLCLSNRETPEPPFEMSVSVKMDNESGAAGLVFHSDGNNRHYGFYPSNGNLRLSCFRGPSVFSWQVLEEVPSPAYLPGDWNHLRVRVEKDRIQCFVNGQLTIESTDTQLTSGQLGLAKFRTTLAEFKQFRVGEKLQDKELSELAGAWFEGVQQSPEQLDRVSSEDLNALADSSVSSVRMLNRKAHQLQQQAEKMRRLAEDVRLLPVLRKIEKLFDEQEPDDLLRGALLIASLDAPDLDIQAYMDRIDEMAGEIKKELGEKAEQTDVLNALKTYLFEENGFHGGRDEYYHPANSHLNRVIDDREGLPITMSILYMELGRRLGLVIEGVGLPGHFVVRHVGKENQSQIIDVFDNAKTLSDDDVQNMVRQFAGRQLQGFDLEKQQPLPILTRVLRNLMSSAGRNQDADAILRYVEALVAMSPKDPQYRLMRAAARHQTGRDHRAMEDLNWLLDKRPPGVDIHEIERMREFLMQ